MEGQKSTFKSWSIENNFSKQQIVLKHHIRWQYEEWSRQIPTIPTGTVYFPFPRMSLRKEL